MSEKVEKTQTIVNIDSNISDKNVKQKEIAELIPLQQGLFAKDILLNRAIPRCEDGLKPVQRRVIYMAYLHHLTSTAKHMKVAKLSGLTLALHPHGDASVSEAITTLSRQWELNLPLIDIHGNNGSVIGTGPAADRYIEARLTKPAELLLRSINHDTVNMIDNYDNTMKEPDLLPAEWPVTLINGSKGIAWGLSTNILPHNPDEVMSALIELAKNEKITDHKLQSIIKGPDFVSGGKIIGHQGINDEYKTGIGRITLQSVYHVDKKKKQIVITEIPYKVSTTTMLVRIQKALEEYQSVLALDSIDDLSTINVKLVIQFRKSATDEQIENTIKVLHNSKALEDTITAITVMVINNTPKSVGLRQALQAFLDFRKQTYKRELQFDYNQLDKRLNIINGLLKLINIADDVIKLAKKCNGKEDLISKLIKKFDFNEAQAEAIASMPIYKLGKQNALSLKEELKDKTTKFNRVKLLLNDEKEFNKEIVKILQKTKDELGEHSRKTQIVDKSPVENTEIETASLIKQQPTLIVIKKDGIIQRMSQKVYDNNIDKYTDKDKIILTKKATTTDGALFFTKNGLSFYRIVDEIENQNVKTDTTSVQTILSDYKADDEIINCDTISQDKSQDKYILSVTNEGMVKLCSEKDLIPSTKTKAYFKKTKKYNGLKRENDFVRQAFILTKNDLKKKSLIVTRSDDKQIKIKLSSLNVQSGSGSGANKCKFTKRYTYKDCKVK